MKRKYVETEPRNCSICDVVMFEAHEMHNAAPVRDLQAWRENRGRDWRENYGGAR